MIGRQSRHHSGAAAAHDQPVHFLVPANAGSRSVVSHMRAP